MSYRIFIIDRRSKSKLLGNGSVYTVCPISGPLSIAAIINIVIHEFSEYCRHLYFVYCFRVFIQLIYSPEFGICQYTQEASPYTLKMLGLPQSAMLLRNSQQRLSCFAIPGDTRSESFAKEVCHPMQVHRLQFSPTSLRIFALIPVSIFYRNVFRNHWLKRSAASLSECVLLTPLH